MAPSHVLLIAIAAAMLTVQCSFIHHVLAQGVNARSGAVYLPAPHHRLLLIGGSNGGKDISSVDLSTEIVGGRPTIESLNLDLPESLENSIAAVSLNPNRPTETVPHQTYTIEIFGGSTSDGRLGKSIYSFPFPNDSKAIRPTIKQPTIDVRLPAHHGVAVAYDITTAPLPNNGPVTAANDRNVYLFGGIRSVDGKNSDNLIVFDPVERTHSIAKLAISSPIPPPRHLGSLIRIDVNRLLLTGGTYNAEGNSTGIGQYQDVWLYDTTETRWTQYPHSLSAGRTQHASLVYSSSNGTRFVVVLGGPSGVPLIEYADVSNTGPWKRTSIGPGQSATLNSIRNLLEPQALLLGDQIVVFGTIMDDPANMLKFGVIKIREEGSDSLSFAWSDTFTPFPASGLSSGIFGFPVWALASIVAGLALSVVAAVIALFLRFRRHDATTFNKVPGDSRLSDGQHSLEAVSFGVAEQALTGQPTTIERVRSPFLHEGVSSESRASRESHSPLHVPSIVSPSRANSALSSPRAWTSTSASKAARALSSSPAVDSIPIRRPSVTPSSMPPLTLLHPNDIRRASSAEPPIATADMATPTQFVRWRPPFATLALPSSPLPHKRAATLHLAPPPNATPLQVQIPQPQDIRRVPSLHVPQLKPLLKVEGVSFSPADQAGLGDHEIVLPASPKDRTPLTSQTGREAAGRANNLARHESDLCLPTSPAPMAGALLPLSSSSSLSPE